jgi:hypothetical protein
MEDLCVEREIILIWILEKWVVNLIPGLGAIVEFCINGNKRRRIFSILSRYVIRTGF